MNEQARASFESADVELNTIYKRLLNQLEDAEAKQKLRERQRAWLAPSGDTRKLRLPPT